MVKEIKYIEGFSDRYSINTECIIIDHKYERPVCQWVDTVGYYQCNLYGEKKRYKRVHRLVAEAFISNPLNLPQVNHKDGNKLNNNIENLEWCNNADNTQHGYDTGLYKYKSRSHAINLYDKQGNYITTYKSIRSMCDDIGLNRKTVTMILKNEEVTNNYNYLFEYVKESQTTIESVAV